MHTKTFLREFASLASGPGGVQKLREVVLNLAVSGRLSSQRPEDGTAEPLVQAAARAIKLAVNDGAIKKPRYFEKPASFDQESQLPPNWVTTTLGNLGLISPRNEVQEDTLSGFVPMAAIDAKYGLPHAFEKRQWGEIKSGYTHIANGDVVLAKITPCFENGKSAAIANLPNGIGSGTTELHVFRQLEPVVDPSYLLAFLKSGSFIETGIPKMTGTAGQKRVPAEYFALSPFPLPPLAEQRRIVAKVDELMALCDELEARQTEETGLKRSSAASALHHLAESKTPEETANRWSLLAPRFGEMFDELETVNALRGTILHLAAHGRLTTQMPDDGLASELLEEVDALRSELLAQNLPTKNEAATQSRKQENQHVPHVLPELPANWQWATLMQCCRWVVDCRNKTAKYSTKGAKLLRTNNIRDGKLNLTDTKFVDDDVYAKWTERYRPEANDLIITREAPMGEVCLLDDQFTYCLGQRLMLASIIPGTFEPKFLLYSLRDPHLLDRVQDKPVGSTVKHFRVGGIETLLVPVPPTPEQKRIVAKVDELMALCDRLEDQVREGERLNAELMASLVHALTETDPDGGGAVEPAELKKDAPAIAAPEQANRDAFKAPETKSVLTPSSSEPKANAASDRVLGVDTKFQEAVLVASIVKTFFDAGGEPIGNFRLQKAVYFARRNMGEHVGEMAYLKKAAGPYNPSMKYSGGIAIAKQKNWLREARGRFGFGHVPGSSVGDAGEWIDTFGYGAPARWVAEHFRYKKNVEWEALATVDYAIEHLQAHGIESDAAQILQYIASDPEWRPKIEKLGLTEMSVGTAMLEVQALFNSQVEGGVA
ncbi:restriction endonuclease subunit S [uncultured Tateyamaria sp.]|uniref:restriction endonuclease subunit S n=1 Tax=uncultured Tateyamaria sp. TaxID=455651 RepID=UPI0026050952|nr:restriction endonuclease subunit S [uncultured Tateyamaria sp.]